jgi:hypothetical protein
MLQVLNLATQDSAELEPGLAIVMVDIVCLTALFHGCACTLLGPRSRCNVVAVTTPIIGRVLCGSHCLHSC